MKKTPILFIALGALALIGITLIFTVPAPEPPRPAKSETAINTTPSTSGLSGSAVGGSSPSRAQKSTGGTISDMAPQLSEEKRQQLDEIQAAMVTYSAEGLPVLTPFLASPDPEIRAAAINAVVQLAVPEGSKVLRDAAKTARTPEEQKKLLEAASYLELPRFPVEGFLNTGNGGAAP